MSLLVSGEPRQDLADSTKGAIKCRIPQRLPPGRQRFQINKSKTASESMSRPKSANRVKDDLGSGRPIHNAPRSARPDPRDRFSTGLKRPSTLSKKVLDQGKLGKRSVITVPGSGTQRIPNKTVHQISSELPDQESIQQQERIEDLSDYEGLRENESISSGSDKMGKLKLSWQENIVQFEKMKNDLKERQEAIMELYALMCNTHQKMTLLGQKENLPPSEDLRIMNIAKLSAEQLLQLCSMRPSDSKQRNANKSSTNAFPAVDMKKLYNMPSKLVSTCEQTLIKRKDIIDWFENLKKTSKGIPMHELCKKINEFKAENEMLNCSLDQAKGDFAKELNEVIDFMRRTANETIALQLRMEELTYEITELHSQNKDLRKQMHNSDHLRTQSNKNKIEELEKELKEEKCKKIFIKDRLSRAEAQIKIGTERASQLEAALEQARSQNWNLERTVQVLHEQNEKLKIDFDKELNKWEESIRENTVHLEEIAEAREKLQVEKEDLEKRLGDLSEYYNESIKDIKHDMNMNVAKLTETEKKYEDEVNERKNLENKVEVLCSQLLESESRCKDVTNALQETREKLNNLMSCENELNNAKRDLEKAVTEIEDYKAKIANHNDTIKEFEQNFKESIKMEENFKSNLISKEEYIEELEKKQSLLEQQVQESECKMGKYEEQLTSLKKQIGQLQEEYGEFENLTELHDMVNQQRGKLLTITRQNEELAQALQNKDNEIKRHIENLTEHEQILEQKDGVIKMLSEKDEEQTNIIKLLRTNLEMRTQVELDLNQQITDKNTEVDTLITNIETRKLQITQLENIILTLEDQTHKASLQRRKDQAKIKMLEQKISEFEACHLDNRHLGVPSNNFDSIIKILEEELETSLEQSLITRDNHDYQPRKKYIGDRRRDKLENLECHKGNNDMTYLSEQDTVPTKIVMGNFPKRTCISSNDEKFKGDNLDCKKAFMNMDTQKRSPSPEPNIYAQYNLSTIRDNNYLPFRGLLPAGNHLKENISRNIELLPSNQMRDEKKSKMFKIASHRL